MNVLVTGGAGFMGSHVCELLGHDVGRPFAFLRAISRECRKNFNSRTSEQASCFGGEFRIVGKNPTPVF
jgi:UDP-glucose 4-epimerase